MAIVDEVLWRTLSPLLDRALELDAAERARLVESVRVTAPETAAELARLLLDHDRALGAGFLEGSPVGSTPTLVGQSLGPYTLVELLGSGGMGAVWRACRSDGRFEGDVAVKLLHPSLLDRESEGRFRREGTILSRLAHPGIARLYDAGISTSGQPYLVLELVEGERIDAWADSRKLDVHGRIRLFLEVADAVAEAHARLVVHRDLKPSNILVDREGRVKLLDFGIATLVDEASGAALARTVTAASALTPEYAAPEQLDGSAITTATDVYSLGVLLYELLAGRHPTVGDDVTPAGLIRAVTQTVPLRMSESVEWSSDAGEAAEKRFELRAATRERLAKALAGDLDTIVAKALKKNPAERYPTVSAFADDLRRHLQDQPVHARPDSAGYRIRKFVARHRIEASAAASIVLALVAATAIAFLQARASARDRDRALADLARAEITNEFSSFLLSEVRTDGGLNAKTDVLSRSETMIERRFAGDPALRAHLLLMLADLFEEQRDLTSARRVIERAFALTRTETDRRLRALAGCQMAFVSSAVGDAERAEELLAESFADLAREPGSLREEARCRMFEGNIAYRRRDFERSIRAGERALELERRRSGPPGRGLDILNELGRVYAAVGRGVDSDRRYGELFAELEAQGRERTQPAYLANTNWAISLQRSGQLLRAAERWGRAVEIARELDPVRGASPFELVGYAMLLSKAGRHEAAMSAIGEALQKTRADERQRDLFDILVRAGRIHAAAGRIEAADEFLVEAAAYLRTAPAPPPDRRPAELNLLRTVLALARGDGARAAELSRATLDSYENAQRPERELVPLLLHLAVAENDRGDEDAALAAAERALDIASESRGDHPYSADVGSAQLEISRARFVRGENSAARAALELAIENLEAGAGDSAPDLVRAMALRAEKGV